MLMCGVKHSELCLLCHFIKSCGWGLQIYVFLPSLEGVGLYKHGLEQAHTV